MIVIKPDISTNEDILTRGGDTVIGNSINKLGFITFRVWRVNDKCTLPNYACVEGLAANIASEALARISSSGGIVYRPFPGEDLMTLSQGGNLFVVGKIIKDKDIVSTMNDGDLLINPPGDIIFREGGEILGLLEDYFPVTNGISHRMGYSEDTYDAGTGAIEILTDPSDENDPFYSVNNSNGYLFNIIIGSKEYEVGDRWDAWINVGEADETQIVNSAYIQQVPENIRFAKPVFIAAGQVLRIYYYPVTASDKDILVSFDMII